MKTPSKKMTAKLVLWIKALLETRQYHQHQIAAIVGVNQGRISETKKGDWDWLLGRENDQGSLI